MAEEAQQGIEIRVVWDGVDEVPIMLVNQALGQVGQQGEVILTFGQMTPPALTGDLEQQRKQAQGIPFLPIKPVARLALTRAGLEDVIRILTETRNNYDKLQEATAKQVEESDGR